MKPEGELAFGSKRGKIITGDDRQEKDVVKRNKKEKDTRREMSRDALDLPPVNRPWLFSF